MSTAIIIAIVWLMCAILTPILANSKGRSPGAWLLVGILFGPLGFLMCGFMPALTGENTHQERLKKGVQIHPIFLVIIGVILIAVMYSMNHG